MRLKVQSDFLGTCITRFVSLLCLDSLEDRIEG